MKNNIETVPIIISKFNTSNSNTSNSNTSNSNTLDPLILKTINNEDINLFSFDGYKTLCKIVDIYDADTCKIVFIYNNTIVKFNCRLLSINAPEIKPRKNILNRDIEIKAAKKCRNKLIQLCTNCSCSLDCKLDKKTKKKYLLENTKLLQVKCGEFDKYGRLLIELFNPESNKSINNLLITEKYVHLYLGKTKKKFTLEELNYIINL